MSPTELRVILPVTTQPTQKVRAYASYFRYWANGPDIERSLLVRVLKSILNFFACLTKSLKQTIQDEMTLFGQNNKDSLDFLNVQ